MATKKTAARKPAKRTAVAKKTAARKPAKRRPVAKKTATRKPAKRTAVAKKTAAGTGRGGADGGGRIRIGDRIVVEAVKVGRAPRAGAVTHVAGTMIRVRWDDGNESSLVPASGSLRVVRRARERLGKRQ